MTVTLTSLLPEDIDAVMDIEEHVFPEPWTRGQFEKELQSLMSVYFKADLDGTLIGYTGILFIADEAHLTTIGVHPDHQGKGIGRLLLCKAVWTAIEKACSVLTLEVRKSNDPARKLYRRFGFSIAGERKGYYSKIGEDAFIMDSPYLQSDTYLRRLENIGCNKADVTEH